MTCCCNTQTSRKQVPLSNVVLLMEGVFVNNIRLCVRIIIATSVEVSQEDADIVAWKSMVNSF